MATSTPMSCARPGGARRRPASAPIASAAQFQRDMERVQQYIRQHAQLDDKDAAALLGVGDARSRQCYDEIQAFLLRKLQLEQARAAAPVASPASDRFLLRDLDDYLDELDPALFDGAATPKSPAALRLGAALSVPPAASYIRRAQEDAKSGQLQQAASFQQPRPTHALARMRSLLKQQPAAVSYTTKDNSFFRFLERRGAVNSVKPPNETENPLRQAGFLRPPTRMGQSENPAPPAAAMRSAAPLPPPPARPGDLQRKGAPPSKDAWLNAIMSKSRAQEASTGTWSPAAAGQAWGQQRATYREQRPSMAAQEMAPRTDRDGFEAKQERPTSGQQREWMERACAQQVRLDEHALRKAFTIAAQEMVIEQDCCFIAKGLCHLCGVSENHFVPVVNFCPDGNPGHSLCREHLRSIYRVRTEDLFAGKNRPMASRRALKCMVCSMSCPCSMCVHEKNHEINRYHRLLLEEHERSTGGNRNAEGRSAYFSNRRAANEDPEVLESPGDDDARESYPAETHLSMEAEEKVSTSMSMEIRTPKRAAKEGVPQLVLTPREHPSPSSSRDVMQYLEEDNRSRRGPDSTAVPSPSAAHVMNCAESEKSLVELLTTLNQSAGQGTPEDNRRQRYSESTEARRGGPYEDNDSDTRKRELEVNTRLANEDSESPSRPPSRQSGRAAKRKRESEDRYTEEDENDEEEDEEDNGEADEDDDDDDDDDGGYELVESPGGTLTSSRSRKVVRKQHRENYSSEDDAPLRPPRSNIVKVRPGKKPVRGPKQPRSKGNGSDDDRGPKRPSPASRKRKSSSAELERASSQDRKNPRNQKSPASKPPHASKKPSERAKSRRHDSSDDDSDIDTNLDYCEVCSRMGDLVCCDVCPRSFHLSCLGMKERDLPEGDWQCAECKKPSHFVGFARKVESQPSAFAKCMQIVKCLRGHPFAKSFLKPVEDVPNYKDIVDQPMDLSTVMSKLKRNAYAVGNGTKGLNLDAFADDIRLIWANCKLFNDDGSGITRAADELAAGFENLLNLVKKKKTPPPASPDSPPKSADVENQSVNQATPDKPSPVDSVSPESEKEKSPASDDKVAPKPVEKEDRAESPKPDPSDANDSKLNIVAQPNSDTAPENDKKTEAATAEKTESPSDNVKD